MYGTLCDNLEEKTGEGGFQFLYTYTDSFTPNLETNELVVYLIFLGTI